MKLAVSIGLAAGTAFFLHAMIPGSHAWPLVWPVAGGAAGGIHAPGRADVRGIGEGLRLAGTTGLVAGLLFLVATVAALAALGSPSLASLASALGADGPVVVSGPAIRGLAITGSAAVLLAALAGGLAFPLARGRT